jgi:hypothetical protein
MPTPAPSISAAPSSSPTFVNVHEGNFKVSLALAQNLTRPELIAFVSATEQFMEQTSVPGGSVTSVMVDVTSQRVVHQGRRLAADNTTKTELQIKFTASAVYKGRNTDFDLQKFYQKAFTTNTTRNAWIILLGTEDTVFLPLRPVPVGLTVGASSYSDSLTTGSDGSYFGVVLMSMAAVGLAISASVYSVRQYNITHRGTELRSPHRLAPTSSDETENTGYPHAAHRRHDKTNIHSIDSMPSMLPPMSPNSIERGDSSVTNDDPGMLCDVGGMLPQNPFKNSNYKMLGRSNQDPPTVSEGIRNNATSVFDHTVSREWQTVRCLSVVKRCLYL